MRRIGLVLLGTILAAGACVNLDKPAKIAECSAAGTCTNNPKPEDAAETASPAPDGADMDDGGVLLPDVAGDAPWVATPDGAQPGQPDSASDAATDAPVATPEAGAPDNRPPDVAPAVCAPDGVPKPAGTPCRPALGPCDIGETCDGVSPNCPADKLAPAGTVCRAKAGDCDIAETCDGISAGCPADGFRPVGTVCREAAGDCDHAESCAGDTADCPSDSLKPSSSVCRAAANTCDPAESCTGMSAVCPSDVPPYAQPAAPTTASATPGELQATISWSAVIGATGYNVKRSTTKGGPYTTIATGILTTTYVDKGLDSNKTYSYVISAIDTIASCESADGSPEVSVKPTGTCVKPAAPTVTATAGNAQVTLRWGAVTNATAYAVDRSETSTTGYTSLALVTAPITTYVDGVVVVGKTYYYRVTAKATCDSDPSAEVSVAPVCMPAATAPAGLTATTPNTGGVVVLTWTAAADAKATDRYYIMRKLVSGTTYTKIDEVVPPTTTYSDTTAANGTAYNYSVTYYNGTCTSDNSNLVTATAACVMDKPVLSLRPGNNKVDLSWTAPANGSLSGFNVYRKDTGNTSLVTNVTGAGNTTYSDTGLTNGTTYTYYVTAVGNCSADSDPSSAVPVCTPLSAPTNLKASAGNSQVSLNWDALTGADHYTVKRGTVVGGPYTALTPASPIKTNSYTDAGLTNGTTYTYVVTASNGSCDSANSNEASATPQPACSQGAPGNVAARPMGSVQIVITWTAARPVPTKYNVSRSTSATGTYASIFTSADAMTSSYSDTDLTLTPDTTYYYQVTAIGSCNTTSGAVSAKTSCAAPAAPSPGITANADGSIKISWNTVNGATAYTVSRSTTNGSGYGPIDTATNITDTSFTDKNVDNAATYYYVVTASNANHQCISPRSSQVSTRSCVIPAAPTNVIARRSGNKQVTLMWTNSTGANSYNIVRSDGYSVRTTSGSPYADNAALNTTAYNYVMTAASDAGGLCSSRNSSPISVPACSVMGSGEQNRQLNGPTAEWCVVSCNDVSSPGGWAQAFACGSRSFYFNGAAATCESAGTIVAPAEANGGYAFYFTAALDGGHVGVQWGNGTPASCP